MLPVSTHIFQSLEEDWNFPGENCQKLECFCITKIRLRYIFSRNFVKIKNPQMIQLNRIQVTS